MGNKDIDIRTVAEKALEDDCLLSELLSGLKSKEEIFRYNCSKVLTLISQERGELLYPKWDYFAEFLNSNNTYWKISAILIIANLTRVDRDNKFEKIFERYYQLLDDRSMITAIYAASNSGKIVKAKPALEAKITCELLNIDETHHSSDRRDLIKAGIMEAFGEYFEETREKEKIIEFVKRQLKSSSPKARKIAVKFLKECSLNP
jgi:hypothetical protein